jgi:hypothetical protein
MTDRRKISQNVPNALRKQIRESDRILEQMHTPVAPAPSLQPVPPTFEVQPFDPSAAPPEPSAAPPPSAEARPAPADDPEQRYRVLQGKYDKETSRLMGAAQVLQEENNRLLRRLEEARAAPPPANTPVPRETQFDLTAVSQKEREEYGDELIQLMAKISKANGGAEVARLTQELNQLKGQIQQTSTAVAQTSLEKVYTELDRWNPSWTVVNNSQEFLDWLGGVDIISGQARNNGLQSAFRAGDAHRVVGIFRAFVEEDARNRGTTAPPPPTVDKNSLLAPGQPRGQTPPAPNGTGKRNWTEQEVEDFYSRVQRKRISEEERTATQKEINLALAEGRIIPRRREGIQNVS